MGFVKSFEEIAQFAAARETSEFYDAEMLTIAWETKPQIVERILPPPLKPTKEPFAIAFMAHYPRTNFGPSYYEGALFLRAEFNSKAGVYCLSMPVTGDEAMASGREVYGYPKKIAGIEFKRRGDSITGWLERHGVRFFEVQARLDGKPSAENFQSLVTEGFAYNDERGAIAYNFKHFFAPDPAPDKSYLDYNPRLVSHSIVFRPKTIEWGNAKVILRSSDYDPWVEIEVVRMLGAVYTVGHNTMLKGSVVAEVDPLAFAPYAFLKWDFWL
jgi:acetoacetate decarboxylase